MESSFFEKYKNELICPACNGHIENNEGVAAVCISCDLKFSSKDSIPFLFVDNNWKNKSDVTQEIKKFYEKTPFPNYDECDDLSKLIQKSRNNWFVNRLNKEIGYRAKIIECGCGTGQLSNYLAIASRRVVGVDICKNSLMMGKKFSEDNGIKSVSFAQMNLFKPCFKEKSFDVVISNGVLHHTSNPKLAVKSISKLVKDNGYLVVGLYHKYGRLFTNLRQKIYQSKMLNLGGYNLFDGVLRERRKEKKRFNAWFYDQYHNPHESSHTIRELVTWFNELGFSVVNTIPKTNLFEENLEDDNLFQQDEIAGACEMKFKEMMMTFTNHKEGGFFVVVGKKVKD